MPIGGVAIAGEGQQLRVGDDGVPGFHEGLGGDLPVGGNLFRHPDDGGAFLMPPAFEMFGEGAEELLKARPAALLAHEDIAAPLAHFGLRQCHLIGLQMREIPLARHLVKAAILLPAETVERAGEMLGMAIMVAQFAAPVQADIVEGAQAAVRLARDEVGPSGVLIDDIIARLGKVFLARGELPHKGPHLLALGPGKFLAGIARCWQRFGAEICVAVFGQAGGRRDRILSHQLGPAHPGAARPAT